MLTDIISIILSIVIIVHSCLPEDFLGLDSSTIDSLQEPTMLISRQLLVHWHTMMHGVHWLDRCAAICGILIPHLC